MVIQEKKLTVTEKEIKTKEKNFWPRLRDKRSEQLVYIDKSGMDNREDYGYGSNELGKRYYDFKSGKRSLRVSVISGLCQGKLVAP